MILSKYKWYTATLQHTNSITFLDTKETQLKETGFRAEEAAYEDDK
jgi:hypothetical protein